MKILLNIFCFLIVNFSYSQEYVGFKEIDTSWNYYRVDTVTENNGDLYVRYYDKKGHLVGGETYKNDELKHKVRVLPNGSIYRFEFLKQSLVSSRIELGSKHTFIEWYENGDLKSIKNYLKFDDEEEVKHGTHTEFNLEGKTVLIQVYDKGKLIYEKL